MTLKVKVNDLHFQYQLRVSKDACLVQIWWFKLKFMTSYRAEKQNFTDGRTDGRADRRTDAGNDNTPSAWKAKGLKCKGNRLTTGVLRKVFPCYDVIMSVCHLSIYEASWSMTWYVRIIYDYTDTTWADYLNPWDFTFQRRKVNIYHF